MYLIDIIFPPFTLTPFIHNGFYLFMILQVRVDNLYCHCFLLLISGVLFHLL